MNDRPNPYKGVPRSQWGMVKEQERLRKMGPPNTLSAPEIPTFTGSNPEPAPAPKINSQAPVEAPPRNLFSGQFRQMEVFGANGSNTDPIPGWRLYWMNDIGDRINRARQSGWEFVMKDEIALQENLVPGNNDLGTQVRKVVNPNLIPPTVAYLMKKPADLDALHQAEIQEVNNRNEAALRQGRVNAQAGDGRYVAGDVQNSLLPKIEISRNLNR